MSRTLDTSKLPTKPYGGHRVINWPKTIGCQLPFVYDDITGILTIEEYSGNNSVVVGYQNRRKKLRTIHLLELKIRDLIDPSKEILHLQNRKTHEAFCSEVRDLYGEEYEILSCYHGSKMPVRIRHNCAACNYCEFSPTPNNFLRGSGCPACNGSPSFPEMCLKLVIREFFPDAGTEKVGGRECDILFYVAGKRIGVQYDGSFFHRDAGRYNEFDRLFLEDESSWLIRVREPRCPELEPHPRMYQVRAEPYYTKDCMQQVLERVFGVLSGLLGIEYRPQLSNQTMQIAREHSQRAHHYKALLDEYIRYLHEHHERPRQKDQKNLQGRMNTAIREARFSAGELEQLEAVLWQYGLEAKERYPDTIFRDVEAFYRENGFLPRQQGEAAETALHRELQKCLRNHSFSAKQEQECDRFSRESRNYKQPSDQVLQEYVQFVRLNQRLPIFGSDMQERRLATKVSHRLSRNSFTEPQRLEIQRLKAQYTRRLIKEGVVEEYRRFLEQNGRLPLYRTAGEEGKLEGNMQRFLRTHQFSTEETREILGMRAPYQRLTRRLTEYERYFGGEGTEFVKARYVEFIAENGRLPVQKRGNRDELDLCRLVLRYLDEVQFPLGDGDSKKAALMGETLAAVPQEAVRAHCTPDATFQEALSFYKETGRFPLHRRVKGHPEHIRERRLAARITSLYRLKRFTPEQTACLDRLRIKNSDRAGLIYDRFFSYIADHEGSSPRHGQDREANRLLNSLKQHMQKGHYTEQQMAQLLEYLPGVRSPHLQLIPKLSE